MSGFRFMKTSGKRVVYFLVDSDQVESLSKIKWYACKDDKGNARIMASKWDKIGKRNRNISLGGYISGVPHGRKLVTDHINRNTLDNRRLNLRLVGFSENVQNSNGRPQFSGFRGVWTSGNKTKPWRSCISKNGKDIHIGVYRTKEEAARAYDKIARELYGEHAYVNFK